MRNNHCSRAHQGDKDSPAFVTERRIDLRFAGSLNCSLRPGNARVATRAFRAEKVPRLLSLRRPGNTSLNVKALGLRYTRTGGPWKRHREMLRYSQGTSTTRRHFSVPLFGLRLGKLATMCSPRFFLPTPLGRKCVKRKQRHYNWICSICARTWTGCTTADRAATCGGYKARKQTLGEKARCLDPLAPEMSGCGKAVSHKPFRLPRRRLTRWIEPLGKGGKLCRQSRRRDGTATLPGKGSNQTRARV